VARLGIAPVMPMMRGVPPSAKRTRGLAEDGPGNWGGATGCGLLALPPVTGFERTCAVEFFSGEPDRGLEALAPSFRQHMDDHGHVAMRGELEVSSPARRGCGRSTGPR